MSETTRTLRQVINHCRRSMTLSLLRAATEYPQGLRANAAIAISERQTAHARIHAGKIQRIIRSDDQKSPPISGREGSAVIASYLPAEVDMVARLGFVIYAAASIAGAVALLVGIVLFVLGNTPGQALGVRIALAGMLAIGFGRAVHFILADV